MNDDEELNRLARDRHRATYLELEREEKMKNWFVMKSGEHDEPDKIPGHEPTPFGCRLLLLGVTLFYTLVFAGIALLWSCQANAYGRLVFLEDERDLGNGFKLCIYSEGVTITRPSYSLCPISIEV